MFSLARPHHETQPAIEYLNSIKPVSDELASIDSLMTGEDLIVHIVTDIGKDYKEITAGVRRSEIAISFDELYEKLVDYKAMLKRHEDPYSTEATITANATVKRFNKHSYNLRHNNKKHRVPPNQQPN